MVQEISKQYKMYSILLKIRDKLVAHRTTENHSNLETGKMYLILNSNDENDEANCS